MKSIYNYKSAYFIVFLGALFYLYEFFLRVFPAVMKPVFMHQFAFTATMFGTFSAAYYYMYTPLQLVVGLAVDHLRLRHLICAAIGFCLIGNLILVSVHSYPLLLVARLFQGFGSAFAFVGALRLAAFYLPQQQFAFFSGICASLGFLGAASAEISLSYVVRSFGWQHAIWCLTLLGLALLLILWFKLKNPRCHPDNESDSSIKNAIYTFFIIFRMPRMWLIGVTGSLIFMPVSVFAGLWGVAYFGRVHLLNVTQAATLTSAIFIGLAIGAVIVGQIASRWQIYSRIIMVGSLLATVLSLVILYDDKIAYADLLILLFFFGFSISCQVITFPMAKMLLPNHSAGKAVAFINALAMLGGMLLLRVFGDILDLYPIKHIHGDIVYSVTAYKHAAMMLPIALGVAFFLSLLLRDKTA